MIRRLYVDNFRSLVDFTWEPGKETLVLGYNGSGKTSALEIVQILRDWVSGQLPLGQLLSRSDWTNWREEERLRVEIDLHSDGAEYRYQVGFGLNEDKGRHVFEENLSVDGVSAFRRGDQFVSLQPDADQPISEFPISARLSVLNVVGDASQGEEVAAFRNALTTMVYVKPNPSAMNATAMASVEIPDPSLGDLSDWLLHLSKNETFLNELTGLLREVWPELLSVYFLEVARDFHRLTFLFDASSNGLHPTTLALEDLSDGERMLIALYTLTAYQQTQPPTTIIIDEPDNFVSLLEVQPWLLKMLDTCPDEGQLILISHNSEIIQTFGHEQVAYFTRKDHASSTRVRKIEPESPGFSLDRWMRRGWLDE